MASSPRIEELRKKFEENPRRYFAPLANEYRKAGDVEQAIAICREYLPQQPGHMSGHIVFGQALYEARSFEEAKGVFETALSLDPENLIALRHLGDIALILNDSEGARSWYTRVLEADPRNEEIQAQLATIEKSMAAASAPTPPVNVAVPAAPVAPTVEIPAGGGAPPRPATPVTATSETLVIEAVKVPPPKPVTATSPTAEINLDSILPSAPPASAPEQDRAEAAPAIEGLEATTAAGSSDSAPGSFSLDGLETTSISGGGAESAPTLMAGLDFGPAGEPPPAANPAPLDLDFGLPASAPPPPAPELGMAGSEPRQPESFSASDTVEVPQLTVPQAAAAPDLDLDLGSLATPPAAAPASTPPAAPVTAPAVASEAPLDLELSLPGAVASVESPPPAPPSEPEAPPPAPADVEFLDLGAPPTPEAPAAPVAEPPADPFLTETMAELYVQQGHKEQAERVYRALLEQRPGDPGLRAKLEQLSATSPSSAAGSRSPSIRDLLLAIARRGPGRRPHWPGSGAEPASEAVAAAPFVEPTAAPKPTAEAEEEARDDRLAGALGFAAADASDQGAARVLARAFGVNGARGEPLLAGEPARPANDEISLRNVFKSEPAPPPSSFSFDQFFSQRASAEGAGTDSQAAESPEEVAQFTSWLEGLKKR